MRHKNGTRKHASLQMKDNVYLCDVCKGEFDNVDELTMHRRSCNLLPKKDLKETCRSVLQSTTLAFVKVHDAVKAAFEEINKEVLPLYQCASNDDEEGPHCEGDLGVRARIKLLLHVHSNFINNGLQRDVFILSDAIIKDIKTL